MTALYSQTAHLELLDISHTKGINSTTTIQEYNLVESHCRRTV